MDALVDWLNHDLALEKCLLTAAQVDAWYAGLSEARQRELRVSAAWWLARFSAQ